MILEKCSGQNLTTPRSRYVSRHTRSVTDSQVHNELEILVGSYSTPRWERRALPRAHMQSRGEDLRPFLFLTSVTTISLLDLHDMALRKDTRFHWTQLSIRVSRIAKVVPLLLYPHVLNTPLFQWGQLWIVTDTWHANPNNTTQQSERLWKDRRANHADSRNPY